MLEMLYSILDQIKDNLRSQPKPKPASNLIEGGVGVVELCNKNYTTPPPEITLTTLRYVLSEIPRPLPSKLQVEATSLALQIAQEVCEVILPVGSSPINPDASEAILKYRKRVAQAKRSAKFLLNQVGYRVPDCSDAVEEVIVDAHKLAKAKREYENI